MVDPASTGRASELSPTVVGFLFWATFNSVHIWVIASICCLHQSDFYNKATISSRCTPHHLILSIISCSNYFVFHSKFSNISGSASSDGRHCMLNVGSWPGIWRILWLVGRSLSAAISDKVILSQWFYLKQQGGPWLPNCGGYVRWGRWWYFPYITIGPYMGRLLRVDLCWTFLCNFVVFLLLLFCFATSIRRRLYVRY